MKSIEIFKTNVNKKQVADRITALLSQSVAGCAFNFDLEDCDKVLRVESDNGAIDVDHIIHLMCANNLMCQLLND